MVSDFDATGWVKFGFDPAVMAWVDHVRPLAIAAQKDPAHAGWWRCDDTWFVGVNALDNDGQGRVADGPVLEGAAMAFARGLADLPLDQAQLSTMFPGYPRRGAEETEAAHRYRARRDSAHVDGLKPFGPDRRRQVDEAHAWLLGVPLTDTPASPFVLWEGSHRIMRAAFREAFAGVALEDMKTHDVTDAYQAARREVFATCPRIELVARPGEAYVLHRHALHGVAPWAEGLTAGPEGRMIAYFRPELPGGVSDWL
ncbi:hypothetical protein [Aliiroseovarius sp.]|uniref:hypothetical protein n=1 Tax=Aliiroseovarius sp. TaxID=1872442 RepID=UPI003BA86DFA